MTRQHVTVALSDGGGDELFGGYNRYQFADRYWSKLMRLPRAVGTALFGRPDEPVGRSMEPGWRDCLLARGLPATKASSYKIHKARASALKAEDEAAVYRQLVSHWNPADLMPDVTEPDVSGLDTSVAGLVERMQLTDTMTYLPDDILTKVDRASMAVALEARVPLIDHRVVEFLLALPRVTLIRGGVSKWLLRQVLYRHVPRELIERPKMGFSIPLGEWLRGPLRDWAETLLSEQRLREAGLLDVGNACAKLWQEHLSGQRNWPRASALERADAGSLARALGC